MKKRFLRLLVGIVALFTTPLTLFLLLIAWAITGTNCLNGIINWIFDGEYNTGINDR